jgi:asparagine synthase (glutamine-hydrolysing)
MCGISGIYGYQDRTKAENGVRKMNLAIQHRGPDADGIWFNDIVGLGHRRLSIIDTSPAGNQPFFSKEKDLSLVFNGEIYNYLELKSELSGSFTFETGSDTEVILAAYRKWGIDCVSHFFGMFGFALWDEKLQSLFLVRDRLGIKPIYYAQTQGGFIFASEIRALLQSDFLQRKINADALADYLRYQTVHAPETIISGVKMLMPGHSARLSAQGIEFNQFWDLSTNTRRDAAQFSSSQIKKDISDILHSSIEIRMRADVPFGAFLSGGIDSSAIVGLMSEISTQPVKTFAVTFHEKEFDESPYSKMIAQKFKTDHTEIKLSANDFLNLVPEALNAMDHPSGDGPNTYVVSKVTRQAGVKMALSGLGGDEIFAGYDVFKRMSDIESKQWLNLAPKFLRQLSGKFLVQFKPSVASEKIAESLKQSSLDFVHLYPIVRQLFRDESVAEILNLSKLPENAVSVAARFAEASNLQTLSKVSIAEISTYMQNVLLRDADQMSMAHALEVRVPFLDHRLVEYVLGVNDQIKYPHTAKQLLTDSLGNLLPREIIDRPKMGFTFPWAFWMKNELKSFCETQLKALESINEINFGQVMILWERFLKGDTSITWSRIWPLVVLGHWIKKNDVQ